MKERRGIFSNLVNNTKLLLNSLFYGLKSADNKILLQEDGALNENSIIEQVVNQNRVSKDLLKGEVTQEVEDLRYRTYYVAEESRNYSYYGGDRAEKKGSINLENPIKFSMKNKMECLNLRDSFDGKDTNRYVLYVKYKCRPRFLLETFCEYFNVDVNSKTVTLIINGNVYKTDPLKRSLFNFLKKKNISIEDFPIEMLNFTTYNVDGVKDLLKYTFFDCNEITIEESSKKTYLLFLTFNDIAKEDLTMKYFSERMAEKYRNKVPKEQNNNEILEWQEE